MASLVSRKVLTPLLGQIVLSLAIQTIAFIAVRQQSWYVCAAPASYFLLTLLQVHTACLEY